MVIHSHPSEFLHYLAALETPANLVDDAQLPSLQELSKALKISVACLREQLEVAEALGLVEVRPRTGIRRLPYSFGPAVQQSLFYALELNQTNFNAFSDLRNQIEASYWKPAVQLLTPEDHQALVDLVSRAWEKLFGNPIQIPHTEHRLLHLTIYSRLENPFVQGILTAYWEAYEKVGFNMYADYDYLQQVWRYHQKMVEAICQGEFEAGYQALVEHKDMLLHHPRMSAEGNPTAILTP